MNSASEDQLMAVAQSCRHYDSGGSTFSNTSAKAEQVSCRSCTHWTGERCGINVFDDVLTSLDQT